MGPGESGADSHGIAGWQVTLIAAIVTERHAAMLGDSCVSEDGLRMVSRSPKVARVGPWLVGAAGDAGACTVLLSRPLATDQSRLLRQLSRVAGEWAALLARPGELWAADSTGVLERLSSDRWAIGSGGEVGLGALAAVRRRTTEQTLRAVAAIVARYRSDVCGPWLVTSLDH